MYFHKFRKKITFSVDNIGIHGDLLFTEKYGIYGDLII